MANKIRIKKSKIKNIIRESIRQVLKENVADDNIYAQWEDLVDMYGCDKVLDSLFRFLDSDTIEDFIESFKKDNDHDYLYNDNDYDY